MILVGGHPQESLHASDRGLAYGDGVFRTMRARRGCILYWPRHYRKLAADCRTLGIECPAQSDLLADLRAIVRAEPDCVLKIIVTRGRGGRGYAPPPDPRPTRIVASSPLPPPRPDAIASGVRARWCTSRLSVQPSLAGVKHLCRLENVLARAEWSDPQIAEGLMLDTAGHVIEGTACNLFLLESGRWITPELTGCGVAGVQRERLLEVLARLGEVCLIEQVTPQRLRACEQALLVNSVIGAWWVSSLDGRHWQRSAHAARVMQALDATDD